MRRKARSGSRDKASFWQMRSFFQTVWFVNASRSPVGRSAKPYAVQDHLKTTVFMLRLLQHYAPLRFY